MFSGLLWGKKGRGLGRMGLWTPRNTLHFFSGEDGRVGGSGASLPALASLPPSSLTLCALGLVSWAGTGGSSTAHFPSSLPWWRAENGSCPTDDPIPHLVGWEHSVPCQLPWSLTTREDVTCAIRECVI